MSHEEELQNRNANKNENKHDASYVTDNSQNQESHNDNNNNHNHDKDAWTSESTIRRAIRRNDLTTLLSLLIQPPSTLENKTTSWEPSMAWHMAYQACRYGKLGILSSLLRLRSEGKLLSARSLPVDAVVAMDDEAVDDDSEVSDDRVGTNGDTTTTLLYEAARNIKAEACVSALLQRGSADPWQGVRSRRATLDLPLWQACRYGRLGAVRRLWQACRNSMDSKPKALAVSENNNTLLSFSNNPQSTTMPLNTLLAQALQVACSFGHVNVVEFLVQQNGAVELLVQNHTWSPWFDAAWAGRVDVLQVLWQAVVSPQPNQDAQSANAIATQVLWLRDDLGGTPWQRSCAGLHASTRRVWQGFVAPRVTPPVLRDLILSPDAHGETSLYTAAWDECVPLLQWLLEHLRVENGLDEKDRTAKQDAVLRAIFHACDNGQVAALQCLLPHYAGTVEDKRDTSNPAHASCIDKAILLGHERGLATAHEDMLRLLTGPQYRHAVTVDHVRMAVQLGRVEFLHILLQAAPNLVTTTWSHVTVSASADDTTTDTKSTITAAEVFAPASPTTSQNQLPMNLLQISVLLCQANKQSHLEYLWFLINLIVDRGLTEYFDEKNEHGKTAKEMAIFAKNYSLAAVLYDPLLTCQTVQDVDALLNQGVVSDLAFTAPRMRPPKGWTCLHTACCLGRSEIVGYLLTLPRVNVAAATIHGITPLHWAARHGHSFICRQILSQYAEPTVQRSLHLGPGSKLHPMLNAARHGHADIVKMMLDTKCFDVNAIDEDDNSALYMATAEGHESVVEVLLSHSLSDIEVNVVNREGETCLQRACLEQNEGIVCRLLAAGAKTEMQDPITGESALHYAAACGFGEKGCRILALLLDHGADLKHTRKDGWTPMHCAVWAHNDEMLWQETSPYDSFPTLRLLFHWGASLEVLDSLDKSPMDVAEHPALRLYLESLQRERKGTGSIYDRTQMADSSNKRLV